MKLKVETLPAPGQKVAKFERTPAAEFRHRLETVTAPALAVADDDVTDLVQDLIDVLCRAYDRGGLAETRRAMDKFKALIKQADRTGGQV
ncbi:MAG: hypothetical protein ACR2GW_13280 [Pyrinomonadaceae bacterium]